MEQQPATLELTQRIGQLSDDTAIRTLALVVDQQGLGLDARSADKVEQHLREAVQQPDVQHLATPRPVVSEGEVARSALLALVEQGGDHQAMVQRALEYTPRAGEKFEPLGLALGALVVVALRTEVKLERDPRGRWSLRVHHRPLDNSALGEVLGQLIGLYTGVP